MLSDSEKETLLNGKVNGSNTLHNHMDLRNDSIKATVSVLIADVTIKDRLHYDEDHYLAGIENDDDDDRLPGGPPRRRRQRKIFIKHNAMGRLKQTDEEMHFDAAVTNTTRYRLAIRYVGYGLSLCLVTNTIVCVFGNDR